MNALPLIKKMHSKKPLTVFSQITLSLRIYVTIFKHKSKCFFKKITKTSYIAAALFKSHKII